jgi:hypothetical protein
MSCSLKLPCAALAWQAAQFDALLTEARDQTSRDTSSCSRWNQAVRVILSSGAA